MSSIAEQISASRGLLRSLEAISNCRAFLTVFGTLVLGVVLTVLMGFLSAQVGGGTASSIFWFIGFLLVVAIFMVGFSAAGFIINDQMRGREQRKIGEAIAAALVTIPRMIGVALLIFLVALLIGLAVVLILLLCKIPIIGPILYGFVFPLSVLLFGACFYAGLFVLALCAPAIWEGYGVMGTLGMLWAIIRTRLLVVVIHSLLLALLVGLVAGLIMTGLMFGTAVTTGLSAFVIQFGGMGMMGGLSARTMGLMSGGSGYLIAGAIGASVIMACAVVIPALVAIAGNCIIFANASEGISTEEYEARLSGALDSVKQKAQAARQQLDDQKKKQSAAAEPPMQQTPSCPQCKGAVSVDDVFCGHCGFRLK